MTEQEQNKKINQQSRQILELQQRVKVLELDVDASGRISEAFDRMDSHIDEVEERLTRKLNNIDARLDRIERGQNEISGQKNNRRIPIAKPSRHHPTKSDRY